MSFGENQVNSFRKIPFDHQVSIIMIPLTLTANLLIQSYCTMFAKIPFNYTPIQIMWISFLILLTIIVSEMLFHISVSKPLTNSFTYWESAELTSKERTEILESTGSFPIKKGFQLACIFIIAGGIYSLSTHFLIGIDTHISILYFHMYVSLSYIYVIISIYLMEKKCSSFAIKIAAQGIELKEKKFFGLSKRANFTIYLVLPIIGVSLFTMHAIFYALHPQTIATINVPEGIPGMQDKALYIKTTLTRPETLLFIMKISFANTFSTCVMIVFYYVRFLNNNKMMQNSLVMLNDKKINQENLFDVNTFSEDSYTMYLINRIIILFDTIIRNNTKTNREIDEISRVLSEVSKMTTENVKNQSSNIEEILATMQSVDTLSKKIETNFDEIITVASKTTDSIEKTFFELNENFDKIKEISETNSITIENLKKLAEKISGISEAINSIDKFAEQAKTIAFNAELEANNINIKGIDFSDVSEETKKLSDSTLELTGKVHSQIEDITTSSEEIIATGNYCLNKTKEGNEICIQLGEEFEKIKQSAKTTSLSSSNIKESLHEQTNSFHQIVETLSQISKSVRNFGASSSSIVETIERLRQNSSKILALNIKYNKKENTQEGNAL